MKIIRKNGTVLEMSTTEYKELFKSDVKKEQKKEKYRIEITPASKRQRRQSICTAWSRAEEKILRESSIKKAKRLLKGRTLTAIYARRSILKVRPHKKHRGEYAKQKERMKFINARAKTIQRLHPEMKYREVMKEASTHYKRQT